MTAITLLATFSLPNETLYVQQIGADKFRVFAETINKFKEFNSEREAHEYAKRIHEAAHAAKIKGDDR